MLPVERRADEPGDELAALERLRHDEAAFGPPPQVWSRSIHFSG